MIIHLSTLVGTIIYLHGGRIESFLSNILNLKGVIQGPKWVSLLVTVLWFSPVPRLCFELICQRMSYLVIAFKRFLIQCGGNHIPVVPTRRGTDIAIPYGCVHAVGYHVPCVLVEVILRRPQAVISMDTFLFVFRSVTSS